MYASTRVVHARINRVGDAVALMKKSAERINALCGTNYSVGVNLGNEPGMISMAATYEHLKDLEKVRAAMWSDAEIGRLMHFAGEVLVPGHENERDSIHEVRLEGGERKEWVIAKTVRCLPGHRLEAAAAGVELAQLMSVILGSKIGFATAVTGDLSRCIMLGNFASLDALETGRKKLFSNADYNKALKDASTIFNGDTQRLSIWQRV